METQGIIILQAQQSSLELIAWTCPVGIWVIEQTLALYNVHAQAVFQPLGKGQSPCHDSPWAVRNS